MEAVFKLIFGIIGIIIIIGVVAVIIGAILSVVTTLAAGGGVYGAYRAVVNYKRAFADTMSFINPKSTTV